VIITSWADGIRSPDSEMRQKALGRLETLYSYRRQILSQDYIPVAEDQPPFQSTSSTRNFIPTSIGSDRFVYVEDPNDFRTSDGTQIPIVYVRLFRDIGWSHEGSEANLFQHTDDLSFASGLRSRTKVAECSIRVAIQVSDHLIHCTACTLRPTHDPFTTCPGSPTDERGKAS
jgi:hypothetical protein